MRFGWTMFVVLLLSGAQVAADGDSIRGFSQSGSRAQKALEGQFDSLYKKNNLREWMRILSAHPHHVGSPYGKHNAEFIAARFREWGYETEIETFYVLFPTPKVRVLEIVEPTSFSALLQEPALAEDATSGQVDEQLPTYNAYSPDGDVTAEIVYVNRGIPDDYEELDKHGISVEGRIVLARYGGSWRGIKPKVAAEHGAVGVILYSDPIDDGYSQGAAYPEDEYKTEHTVQRGSILDMPLRAGDPLTPDRGATKKAKRLKRADAETLPTIPTLPISYHDALPILKALAGPVAPESWRGTLPLTYRMGPGPVTVHLKLEFNWDTVPAYDVIARMKGSVWPDQWIMRGNHHDASVNEATDPISGLVSLMEEARVVAELARTGQPPKRSVIFAAWDAEEQGLLGSTEWVEHHAEELKEHLVAYINTDANLRGFLYAEGSHALEAMFSEVADDVIDPEKGVSIAARNRASRLLWGTDEQKKRALEDSGTPLEAMGSGSDYTPFIQYLGIPSMDVGFYGEDDYGTYHSIYDSFDYYTRLVDPDLVYGEVMGKMTGRLLLRLANAEILPFEFTHFARTVEGYAAEIMTMTETMREETERLNRLIDEEVFELISDPLDPVRGPEKKDPVPHLNFAPMKNVLERLGKSADTFDAALKSQNGATLDDSALVQLNRLLFTAEQLLTRPEGLPRRPWYKHHIYAPGFYTGYDVKTLPGVREAIEARNWVEVDEQISKLADVLNAYSSRIDAAVALLNQ